MSAKVTVTGNLGRDPEVRYTNAGTAVSELNIAATHSTKDKQTGQWSDVGAPLWLRATFWEDQAEHLAQVLHKGDRVTVEGTLTRREYTKQDGTTGESLELHFPRFLGVVPKRSQDGPGRANSGGAGTWTSQGASGPQNGSYATDQWGGPSDAAPF